MSLQKLKKALSDYGLLALSLAALIGISILSIYNLHQMKALGAEIYEKGFNTYKQISTISLELGQQKNELNASLSEFDPNKVNASQENLKNTAERLSPLFQNTYPEIAETYTAYIEGTDKYYDLIRLYAQDQAATLLNEQLAPLEQSIAAYFSEQQKGAETLALTNVEQMQNAARTISLQISIFALALLAVIGTVGFILGRAQMRKNQQISVMNSCLASMQTNVLIVDNSGKISFANMACIQALKNRAHTIHKQHPGFDAEKVVGHAIAQTPYAQIADLISKANALKPGEKLTHRAHVGDLTIHVNIAGIYDGTNHLGTYVDWEDITEQVTAQKVKDELEGKISQIAQDVNAAAEQISSGNLSLSERTEAQAANVEQTTATMQNITTQVTEAAREAHNATELTQSMRTFAESGQDLTAQTNAAMQAIAESSNKINTIIGVIDEIAFQTNLLALNAAVEAARAGEAGRGFAVVAGEVRTLAGRSANAAKEIKTLIEDAVKKVSQGSLQVTAMNDYVNKIITDIQTISNTVTNISQSAEEQAHSITEVNKAVSEVDSFTQQNAALVEEAASASRALEEQSVALTKTLAEFKRTKS